MGKWRIRRLVIASENDYIVLNEEVVDIFFSSVDSYILVLFISNV